MASAKGQTGASVWTRRNVRNVFFHGLTVHIHQLLVLCTEKQINTVYMWPKFEHRQYKVLTGQCGVLNLQCFSVKYRVAHFLVLLVASKVSL